MNITQIEKNLKDLIGSLDKNEFIYDLLLAYGRPRATISKLKIGMLNLSSVDGEVSWKKQLFFKEKYNSDLHLTVSELMADIMIYLIRMADKLNVDLESAVTDKIDKNAIKHSTEASENSLTGKIKDLFKL